jgi:hypothetical protein
VNIESTVTGGVAWPTCEGQERLAKMAADDDLKRARTMEVKEAGACG